MASRCIILLGMHRSGTSALAGCLSAHGVKMGEQLLGAAAGNPLGHFEDEAFFHFHQKALALRHPGQGDVLLDDSFVFNPSDAEKEEAAALLRTAPSAGSWGWKDPRTCLFAEFWLEQLPEANVLLVYRHPLEVADSILRRGTDPDIVPDPSRAVKAFSAAMKRALHALQGHKGATLIVHAARALEQSPLFLELARERFAQPLEASGEWNFQPELFKQLPISTACHALFEQAFPEEAALYDELERRSALSARPFITAEADPLGPVWAALSEQPALFTGESRHALLGLMLEMLSPGRDRHKAHRQLREDFHKLEASVVRNKAKVVKLEAQHQHTLAENNELSTAPAPAKKSWFSR